MASAADLTDPPAPTAAPTRRGFGLATLLIVVVLATAAAGGGAWFYFNASDEADDPSAAAGDTAAEQAVVPLPAAYLALDPAFVVNLEDPEIPHYLQVDMQVMSRDPIALETVRVHLPRIRNSLLMLFAQQKPADLATREGKEQLRVAALAEVQKVMQEETGQPVVEAVYFTSFVMQ